MVTLVSAFMVRRGACRSPLSSASRRPPLHEVNRSDRRPNDERDTSCGDAESIERAITEARWRKRVARALRSQATAAGGDGRLRQAALAGRDGGRCWQVAVALCQVAVASGFG